LKIIECTGNKDIDLIKLDISSFESIKNFCKEFRDKYDKLDVLIHNAAYFNHGEKEYQLSVDNIELNFATNAFGPLLMTKLLIDLLSKSEDPRILNACTTNIRHFFDPKRQIEFDNLKGEYKNSRKYSVYKMYGDSKMTLLMLTFKMAEEYKSLRIKVNAIQIPAIKTSSDTVKKFKSVWRVAAIIQNCFAQLPETMGKTYYHICTADEFVNTTGQLINDKLEIVNPSTYPQGVASEIKQFFDSKVYPKYANNKELIDKVWVLSNELIN